MESILHTSDEFELKNTTWEDNFADPKIELLERLIKSGHIVGIHDWPGGDFTCNRVHSPAEKTIIKDYDATVLRRRKKTELLAKRKRSYEEVGVVET